MYLLIKEVKDSKLLRLINKFLKAGEIANGKYEKT